MQPPQLQPTYLPAPYPPYPLHLSIYYPPQHYIPLASLALPPMQHTTLEYHQNQILLRQSSLVAMAHEELDTILDQYIN